jgi:hypothetical protein
MFSIGTGRVTACFPEIAEERLAGLRRRCFGDRE